MHSITSLINKLSTDFPEYTFVPSELFYWSPDKSTIYYDKTSSDTALLVHELAHALLGHRTYPRDILLLAMERDAWQHAQKNLAAKYNVTISTEVIEDALDTYRDWLHSRSTCPNCDATGIQTKRTEYKCLACRTQWRVNEARECGLRRYRINNQKTLL